MRKTKLIGFWNQFMFQFFSLLNPFNSNISSQYTGKSIMLLFIFSHITWIHQWKKCMWKKIWNEQYSVFTFSKNMICAHTVQFILNCECELQWIGIKPKKRMKSFRHFSCLFYLNFIISLTFNTLNWASTSNAK